MAVMPTDDPRRDPAEPATSLGPSRHRVAIYRSDPLDRSRTIVDEVEILDRATGEGERVVAALAPADPPVDLGPPYVGESVRYELHLAPEDDRWVQVVLPTGVTTHVRRTEIGVRILGDLTRHRLDAADAAWHLHAAAASTPEGDAVVLLGASGSGKSTMTSHLLDQGLQLITDEQVTVDRFAGVVAGFTRPLGVKASGGPHLPGRVRGVVPSGSRTLLRAEDHGARHRLLGVPRIVVELDRTDEVTETTWSLVDRAEAIQALAMNNLDLVRDPVPALETLGWLAATVPTIRLRYCSSSDAARVVASLMADPPPFAPAPWSVTSADAAGPTRPKGRTARAAEGVVAVHAGDRSVLLHVPTLAIVRLDPKGSAIWRRLPTRRGRFRSWRFHRRLRQLGFLVHT